MTFCSVLIDYFCPNSFIGTQPVTRFPIFFVLTANPNISLRSKCGSVAAHYAAEHGHVDLLSWIYKYDRHSLDQEVRFLARVFFILRDGVKKLVGDLVFLKWYCK